MAFFYGSDNLLAYLTINGTPYYYEKNLQGDIIGLIDGTNNEVVTYSYDCWGKLLGIGGALASTVGAMNPFRYRGYYYDSETQLYYLQSRYYSPEWGRFISQDDPSYLVGGNSIGLNLYGYCKGNPVMYTDPTGHDVGGKPTWLVDAVNGIWYLSNVIKVLDCYVDNVDVFGGYNLQTSGKYNDAISWISKNGYYKSIKSLSLNDKNNYNKYDCQIVAWTNYWNYKRGLANNKIDPNWVKAMMMQESHVGSLTNLNGNVDVMQTLTSLNPALYVMAKVDPKNIANLNNRPRYDKNEGVYYGIPRGGYGRIRTLFSNNKFYQKDETDMMSICFGIRWLAYKIEVKGTLAKGITSYNGGGDSNYYNNVRGWYIKLK